MLTEKLKALNVDRLLEVDEAVELSAAARNLEQEYVNLELPVPDWLQTACDTLRGEIARRTHASELENLRKLQAQLDGLKTAAEKRKEVEAQIAASQKRLGLAPAKAGK